MRSGWRPAYSARAGWGRLRSPLLVLPTSPHLLLPDWHEAVCACQAAPEGWGGGVDQWTEALWLISRLWRASLNSSATLPSRPGTDTIRVESSSKPPNTAWLAVATVISINVTFELATNTSVVFYMLLFNASLCRGEIPLGQFKIF